MVSSALRNNGQEHRVGVAHGEIARFGVFKNLLLIEESRWVLLQDPALEGRSRNWLRYRRRGQPPASCGGGSADGHADQAPDAEGHRHR